MKSFKRVTKGNSGKCGNFMLRMWNHTVLQIRSRSLYIGLTQVSMSWSWPRQYLFPNPQYKASILQPQSLHFKSKQIMDDVLFLFFCTAVVSQKNRKHFLFVSVNLQTETLMKVWENSRKLQKHASKLPLFQLEIQKRFFTPFRNCN